MIEQYFLPRKKNHILFDRSLSANFTAMKMNGFFFQVDFTYKWSNDLRRFE